MEEKKAKELRRNARRNWDPVLLLILRERLQKQVQIARQKE
ncbi:MAG: hypothetical protein ACJ71B_01120 [Nitrososphaera sp.]